jgi:hypothetical protein
MYVSLGPMLDKIQGTDGKKDGKKDSKKERPEKIQKNIVRAVFTLLSGSGEHRKRNFEDSVL